MNEILIVKCLSDNYAYIYSNKNGDAFVVDPSEAGPVTVSYTHLRAHETG